MFYVMFFKKAVLLLKIGINPSNFRVSDKSSSSEYISFLLSVILF